jgi:hypothetical protein
MIALRRHTATDYAGFPDIDATSVGILDERDTVCLGEVGECLLRFGANRRFGVGLLHSHFPIESGETLVEEAHTDAQMIILRPEHAAPPGLFATSVCFDDAGISHRDLRLVGLEFAPKQALAGIYPINDLDDDVLVSVAGILHQHGKIARFGVRLLHDPLKLNGRVLLETCDSVERALTCKSTAEDDPAFAHSIATVFCWEGPRSQTGDGSTVNQGCMQFCKSIQRCAVDRRGHHERSGSHEQSHDQGP